jgi:hypothetical protein
MSGISKTYVSVCQYIFFSPDVLNYTHSTYCVQDVPGQFFVHHYGQNGQLQNFHASG